MNVEFIAGNVIVTWEQQQQLSDEFVDVFLDLLYPMGGAFAPFVFFAPGRQVLVDGDPYERWWTRATVDDSQAVFRDISASSGAIFRVCNTYATNGYGVDLPTDLFSCISQTFDISALHAPDTRGPVVDLIEIAPSSIDPGDAVTVTLWLRDLSGISEDGFTANFFAANNIAELINGNVQLVSLTKDGNNDVAVLQVTWPAWEFGCGEFPLGIGARDSLGNYVATGHSMLPSGAYSFPINVSCAAPTFLPPDPPTDLKAECMPEGVIIIWTQPSGNGGPAVTSYVVDYSSDAGETWTTSPELAHHVISWDRARLITELVDGAAYLVRAAAVNAVGVGDFSDTLSLTASPVAPGVPDCQS